MSTSDASHSSGLPQPTDPGTNVGLGDENPNNQNTRDDITQPGPIGEGDPLDGDNPLQVPPVDRTPPNAPGNFRVSFVDQTSVVLMWEAEQDSSDGFVITRETGSNNPQSCGGADNPTILDANARSASVVNLMDNTNYNFRICALNSVPFEVFSASVTLSITTASYIPNPNEPSVSFSSNGVPAGTSLGSGPLLTIGFGKGELSGDGSETLVVTFDDGENQAYYNQYGPDFPEGTPRQTFLFENNDVSVVDLGDGSQVRDLLDINMNPDLANSRATLTLRPNTPDQLCRSGTYGVRIRVRDRVPGTPDSMNQTSAFRYLRVALEDRCFPEQKLTGPDNSVNHQFGEQVAAKDDRVIVSSPRDPGGALLGGGARIFERQSGSFVQTATLYPSDLSDFDTLYAVAIDGNTAVVGTHEKDSGQGAVYVFEKSGNTWGQVQKIKSAGLQNGDQFGWKVSLSGSWLAISAKGANSGRGRVYIYTRNGDWRLHQTLSSQDNIANQIFGSDLEISANYLVVGQPMNTSNASSAAGNAHVFRLSGGSWNHISSLNSVLSSALPGSQRPSNGHRFGNAVSVDGNSVAVTAHLFDDGRAYVFECGTSSCSLERSLEVNGSEEFGQDISLRGNTLVVTDHKETARERQRAGVAYTYKRANGQWPASPDRQVFARTAQGNDFFGVSVHLANASRMVAGVFGDDDKGASSGSAVVFELVEP